jgi:hypothetical protein
VPWHVTGGSFFRWPQARPSKAPDRPPSSLGNARAGGTNGKGEPLDSQSSDGAARPKPFLGKIFRSLRRPATAASSAAEHAVRKLIAQCHALLSERGEVSGGRLAAQTLDAYKALDDPAKEAFFDQLVGEFSPEPLEV